MNRQFFQKYWGYVGLLEDDEVAVLVRYFGTTKSVKRIAKMLKMSEKTVLAIKDRGLAKMRSYYLRYHSWEIEIDDDGQVYAIDPMLVKGRGR